MRRVMTGKQSSLQAMTTLVGMIFLFVVMTANFYVYHTRALHIDSPDQVLIVGKKDKIIKLLPVFGEIVHLINIDNPIPSYSIFIKESFSAIFSTPLYLLPPRSPPE